MFHTRARQGRGMLQSRSRNFVIAFLLIVVLPCAGCGNAEPKTSVVRGKVFVDSKPLKTGLITFHPTEGRPAMASIESDGTYELSSYGSGDGAAPGDYVVTIDASDAQVIGDAPEVAAPTSLEQEIAQAPVVPKTRTRITYHAPPEYASKNTSPLKATVLEKDVNEINFEIP